MAEHAAIPLDEHLRYTGTTDFANGRLEWRRLLAEAGGTFFLVLAAAGAGVVNAVSHGQVGRNAAVTAPGIMVLALIYTIGATSGAHLNPAVTVAFAAPGHFPWHRVPGYVLAQVCGATGAAALLRSMFGTAGRLGGTFPGHGISAGIALITETVLSFGLMTVILGTSSGARNVGVVWIYLAGPTAGSLLAVGLAWALRGRPSPAADLAAQGITEDGSSAVGGLPVQAGMANPTDSLEVRWITPGPVTPAMREWFARFPSGTETRDDAYLLQPPLRGLAVKLRSGSFLDLKAFLGSPGLIELPTGGRGTLELWRKWSFSGDDYTPGTMGSDAALGWVVVHKERIGAWFPLASGDTAEPGGRQAVQTGCAVELTAISLGTAPYTSVGFEARGAPELLRPALEHAIGPVFAVAPPPESRFIFSPGNSQSYTQWLHQLRNASQRPAAGTTMRGSSLS